MKSLEEIYSGRFFRNRHKLHWRAEHFCKALVLTLQPKRIIDLGCATNDIVEYFNNHYGIGFGIEGSKEVLHYINEKSLIKIEDLRIPVKQWSKGFLYHILKKSYDLCLCLEVLEHIEPEYADNIVDTICHFSDQALVSAAPVGQKGHYHVNCQPYEYWIEKFALRGYFYNRAVVDSIKKELEPWRKKDGIKAYWKNMLFFRKGATNEV